jgi:hypothetical protein
MDTNIDSDHNQLSNSNQNNTAADDQGDKNDQTNPNDASVSHTNETLDTNGGKDGDYHQSNQQTSMDVDDNNQSNSHNLEKKNFKNEDKPSNTPQNDQVKQEYVSGEKQQQEENQLDKNKDEPISSDQIQLSIDENILEQMDTNNKYQSGMLTFNSTDGQNEEENILPIGTPSSNNCLHHFIHLFKR